RAPAVPHADQGPAAAEASADDAPAGAAHGHAEAGHCDDDNVVGTGQSGGGLKLLLLLALGTLAAWVLWAFPPQAPAWAHPRPWRRHPGGSRLLIAICVSRV
ncbi:hypothetical protein ACFOVU_06870, partial [Nocardiopsis sediminis]